MPAVVQHLAGSVDSLDVASAGEMRSRSTRGCRPTAVSFAGPGKTDAELTQAVAAGVTIELESRDRGRSASSRDRRAPRHAAARRRARQPGLRSSRAPGMRMGGGPQQFGVDAEQVPGAAGRAGARSTSTCSGFHVFAGSQNLQRRDPRARRSARPSSSSLRARRARAPQPSRYLNLGGGFGIPYFEKDQPLDLAAVGDNLAELVDGRARAGAARTRRVVIELGRYLVGEAGVYVTRVVDRKVSRGADLPRRRRRHAPPARRLRQLRPGHPAQLPARHRHPGRRRARPEPVTVVGCLCTPLDLLGDDVDAAAAPRSATSSSCSRPAPTASRPAPPRSWATPHLSRSSSDTSLQGRRSTEHRSPGVVEVLDVAHPRHRGPCRTRSPATRRCFGELPELDSLGRGRARGGPRGPLRHRHRRRGLHRRGLRDAWAP